jgi:hypothetical protein
VENTNIDPTRRKASAVHLVQKLEGATLDTVRYHLLRAESAGPSPAAIEEVVLRANGDDMFLSWIQHVGVPEAISLRVAPTSALDPKAVVRLEVTSQAPWNRHRGTKIQRARLWGVENTPFAMELQFATGAVWVGIGLSTRQLYGPGEDVLVFSQDEVNENHAAEGLVCMDPRQDGTDLPGRETT